MATVSMLGRLRDWTETSQAELGRPDPRAGSWTGRVNPRPRLEPLMCGLEQQPDSAARPLVGFCPQNNRLDDRSTIQRVTPLLSSSAMLNGATLDIVTFGMPVRYGWDPSGLGKLLHIVNHRSMRTDGKTWLSKMELPQITMEMPIAGWRLHPGVGRGRERCRADDAKRRRRQTKPYGNSSNPTMGSSDGSNVPDVPSESPVRGWEFSSTTKIPPDQPMCATTTTATQSILVSTRCSSIPLKSCNLSTKSP